MSSLAVLGNSPVTLLGSSGRQVGIPLSLLTIKDGAIDTSRVPKATRDAFQGDTLAAALGLLLRTGTIDAAPLGAPVVAMSVNAKAKGALGNAIVLDITAVEPNTSVPGDSKVTVKLFHRDSRAKLTPATVGAQLGTPDGASAPGLVTLTAAAAKLPAALAATKLGGTAPLSLDIPGDGGGKAFTVQATGNDALFADLTIAIDDVDAAKQTFTLTIELSHPEGPVKLAHLGQKLQPLVDIQPGAGGFAVPALGKVTLGGGADAAPGTALAAHADILSD